MKAIGIVIAVLILGAAYLWAAMSWSYSAGERAGWVQKLSRKGWLCKTWEGELALVSMPGGAQEKFLFTVLDDDVAARLNRLMGRRVSLHYEEKVGLPTSCFGETRHYVTNVTVVDDIPLGPGISIPQLQPQPPAVPPAPAPGPAPAPAPPPATAPAK